MRLRKFSLRTSMKKVSTTTMPKVAITPRTLSSDSSGSAGDLIISTGIGRWREGVEEWFVADAEDAPVGGAARSLLISFMVSEALLRAVLFDQCSVSSFCLMF